MKPRLLITLLSFVLLLACSPMSQRADVGDNSSASVHQEQDKTSGSKIYGGVDDAVTNNLTGISPLWFMAGCFVFGMLIPQPRFIRLLF